VQYELYSENRFLAKIEKEKSQSFVISRSKAAVGKISPVFMESCSYSGFCFILLFVYSIPK